MYLMKTHYALIPVHYQSLKTQYEQIVPQTEKSYSFYRFVFVPIFMTMTSAP